MYRCNSCNKVIKKCPACKHGIIDHTASLINQITGLFVFLTLIFVALEIKVKEQTELAMEPFRKAQEESAKRNEVKESKPLKKTTKAKASDKNKKKKKRKKISGKEGDFRAGLWDMLKSEIEEAEKAQVLEVRNDPYNLDYLTKVSDYDVIARYLFAQNRLTGGCYILLGKKIILPKDFKNKNHIRLGQEIPAWVKLDFNYYKDYASDLLTNFTTTDQFFYEMYTSLISQYGPPKYKALKELENVLSRQDKIESVIAFNRLLSYAWESKRSKIYFHFACYKNQPYFRLEYLSKKSKIKREP